MSPPFGFFKKKDKVDKRAESTVETPQSESLSIQQVRSLLQELEDSKVRWLAASFEPLRQTAENVLASLATVADEMQREKIKLQDLEKRYGATVETARRTVVSALRRESSTALVPVESIGDAKKFRERLDSILNRMGEVSGSHSKMLNNFMKKHADRMKSGFSKLEDLQKESKSVFAIFEQERAPIVRCASTVNTITQKLSSIQADEESVRSLESDNLTLAAELERTRREIADLRGSPEYSKAQEIIEKLTDVRERWQQFRNELSEMFSHVSRALTKYSYNVSKETERRLQVMSDEPWKMFEEPAQYLALLQEIRKSVGSGQIQLKDADRILQNLDSIHSSFPRLQEKSAAIAEEMSNLESQDAHPVRRVSELEGRVVTLEQEIERNKKDIEQKKKQIDEKNAEVDSLLWQVSENLTELTGQRYKVTR